MKSLAELQAIRDKMRQQIDLRDSGDDRIRVVVGMATCGIAAGARPGLNAFLEEGAKRELKNVSEHLVNGRVVTEYTIGAAE